LFAKVAVFVELFLRGERLRAQELELLQRATKQAELERAGFAALFVGVVSHDLRTPLTAMMSTMQLLGRRLEDDDSKALLARALSSGNRMARMIDQLLDLTRVRLGGGITLSRVELDLGELVARVVEEQRAAHPGREFDVRCSADLRGRWDADRLEQIVQNLVGNAVAHGAKAEPVTITIASDSANASLAVHNVGPPVPYELRTSLFDPFRRGGEHSPSSSGGLGLGLYIVQQVATAHGGRVTLDSDETGTTFRVELPRGP
jgi:signal transduction histidine kinase